MTAPKPGKQPADHKPKTEKPKIVDATREVGVGDEKRVLEGREVTLRGVTVFVPHEALNDFELMDDIRAVDLDRNGTRLPSLLRRLTGDEGYRAVMAHLRGDNGRVSIDAGAEFVSDLIAAFNPN